MLCLCLNDVVNEQWKVCLEMMKEMGKAGGQFEHAGEDEASVAQPDSFWNRFKEVSSDNDLERAIKQANDLNAA